MDEVVSHCIRELSFDGDLGCNVSRLKDFVLEFYARNAETHPQTVDAAFLAFVWSMIVQQPDIRVGTVPPGAAEVWIAPQVSKINKKKRKGGDVTGFAEPPPPPAQLDEIPDAKFKGLEELKADYGENLRIAASTDTVFVSITGSHIRSNKLTPMVYTALQFISRGREAGISTVDLSKKTGYDAKTCHYVVEKLVELDLVEKRKKSGIGTNMAIHKYFFQLSEVWQKVVAEETKAMQAAVGRDEDGNENEAMEEGNLIAFEPIDSRHLSSLPLLRARLERLLKNSPHQMHAAHNLIVALGFANPAKTDRRFFQTRLRELEALGVIEKVQVPQPNEKMVTCIRLLTSDEVTAGPSQEIVNVDKGPEPSVIANVIVQRQLVDLVHASGTEGMTLNELSRSLRNFDKRIIDTVFKRFETSNPPPHLADVAINVVEETHGRERRHKFFTRINYARVAEKEDLSLKYPPEYFEGVGGFMQVNADVFYEDDETLHRHVDELRGKNQDKPRGRPRKMDKPTQSKKKQRKNPLLSDGSVKKGRPRKEWATIDGGALPKSPYTFKKRKRAAQADKNQEDEKGENETRSISPPKKRRRSPIIPEDEMSELIEETEGHPVAEGGMISAVGESSVSVATIHAPKKQDRRQKSSAQSKDKGKALAISDSLPTIATSSHNTPASLVQPVEFRPKAIPKTTAPAASGTARVVHRVTIPLTTHTSQLSTTFPSTEASTTISSQPLMATTVDDSNVVQCTPLALDNMIDPSLLSEEMVDHTGSTLGPPIHIAPSQPNIHEASISSASHSLSGADTQITPIPAPSSKRARIYNPPPVRQKENISQLRREREILRLIKALGGIVNVSSKEFYESHAKLLETMASAGEPISTKLGSRIDKRTLDSVIRSLESQNKACVVTTAVMNTLGASRQVKVVYLPEVHRDTLNAFLAELGRSQQPQINLPNVRVLEEQLDYGGRDTRKVARMRVDSAVGDNVISLQDTDSAQNTEKAEALMQQDDESIRASLLTEPATVMQMYGFITGKAARLRAFHLHILEVIERGQSAHVVSQEHRIISFSYFSTDFPVGIYNSVISCTVFNDFVFKLLSTDQGRNTPVSQLSAEISGVLELNKARFRIKLLDLLGLLYHLRLVVPLEVADPSLSLYQVPASANHPTSFLPIEYDGSRTLLSPQYWQLATSAPLYLWALSAEAPPFWRNASVRSTHDIIGFWRDLQKVSIDEPFAEMFSSATSHGNTQPAPLSLAKFLRRPQYWKSSYSFSFFQKKYLRRFIEIASATTPLQDQDSGALRLAKISHVVNAPIEAVRQFYEQQRIKILREIKKIASRRKKEVSEVNTQSRSKHQQKLAEIANASRQQREQEWADIVNPIQLALQDEKLAARINRIRERYLKSSGADRPNWEAEVAAVIASTQKPTKGKPPGWGQPHPLPPRIKQAPNERSVEELIAAQGPPLEREQKQRSKSDKGKEKEKDSEDPGKRRSRFNWNKDYDELARDASAIIHARCRNDIKRLDWAGLEKVFPSIPRNSVRQRIVNLRKQPGADTYLRRLEDRWYELWMRYGGTPELPDDDPDSLTDFDMITHMKFLRNYVDKNALRVGFVETDQVTTINLPNSVEELEEMWDIVEKPITSPQYDFIWTALSVELREKDFLARALTADRYELPPLGDYPYEPLYVADTALKMVLATPNELYDADDAANLLHDVGEDAVKTVARELLDHGVLSKLVRDPSKPKPGRTLKISEPHQNLLQGPLAQELFQDAAALEELMAKQEDSDKWREWPIVASDGDTAALLELVSEGKIDFRVDTAPVHPARSLLDWNSKKADDDHIETTVQVRFVGSLPTDDEAPTRVEEAEESVQRPGNSVDETEHGITANGKPAACRKWSTGPIDCSTCLTQEKERVLTFMDKQEVQLVQELLQLLYDANANGIPKDKIQSITSTEQIPLLARMVELLVGSDIPLAFWTGYSNTVLVSATHLSEWSVIVSKSGKQCVRVFPRRWIDITGRQIDETWEAIRRTLVGVVLQRPGVTQAELRWHLKHILDRQELHDMLLQLLSEGILMRLSENELCLSADAPPDNAEERTVFWSLDPGKHWYEV